MNALDYMVLVGTMVGIAAYGAWRTRGRRDIGVYMHGDPRTRWLVIGLSVMATQASAVTFLSMPGEGFENGLRFVQIYFGLPLALIIISIFFLPVYRRLNVNTAYEYLGKRFDTKTRLLGACLFLLQRGLAAGITIYTPAIVLSTVFGWPLNVTILCAGVLVLVYTVTGGNEAVIVTQKYQIGIIFIGMATAFLILIAKLPSGMGMGEALTVANGFEKLNAVNFSFDITTRYTVWSGLFGGIFLSLSYFGADQSQVQRYLSGTSLRESRLGLMFNALLKIPMQFVILLLGVFLFVFYQFERPPIFFNKTAWEAHVQASPPEEEFEEAFTATHTAKREAIERWVAARRAGDATAEAGARGEAVAANERLQGLRETAREAMAATNGGLKTKDADYIFISFVLDHLPHGIIGLLIAAFFAAAFSSLAAELSALGETTTIDIYRHVLHRDANDAHYLAASRGFTILWGSVAIMFALFANMVENLIQAINIVGSVLYGVPLALLLTALFIKRIGGTAVFWGALAAQALVFVLYAKSEIGYIWFNLIGCAACVLFSLIIQAALRPDDKARTS